MEEKVVALLRSIGLTKNEVDVYLDILKNHASTAYNIANRIGLHRSSVYDSLKKLQQLGFIVEIQELNRKLYQTKEYSVIEDYLKQKQSEFQKIAPYLKEISNTTMPEGAIAVSYGLTRLRTTLSSIFDLNQEVFIWTLPKNTNEILGPWFFEEIGSAMKKKEISLKVITYKTEVIPKEILKNTNVELKHMDEDTNLFTITCNDLVFIIVLANPTIVVEIKNMEIAEGFKSRFKIMWEKAKETSRE